MKTLFRNTVIAIFSFIVLTTCTNPFASDEEELGRFTIRLGTSNAKANNSRAVTYPPSDDDLANLKFIVHFEPVGGKGTAKTVTVEGSSAIEGSIAVGVYKVTMEVKELSGTDYARGVAVDNPVEIQATNNHIHVEAYGMTKAGPPVISAKPQGNALPSETKQQLWPLPLLWAAVRFLTSGTVAQRPPKPTKQPMALSRPQAVRQ